MTSNVDPSTPSETGTVSSVHEQHIQKKQIKFNSRGCPVGPNATHFQDRVGKFVKTFISIKYISWLDVPTNFKDDVWSCITREFEVPDCLREHVEKPMPDAFRKFKHKLRKYYLDIYPNLEAQKLNVPPRVKKEDWVQFCINENDEKQKQKRAQNKENRKHSVYGHTGGRKSAAMIEEEMLQKQEDPTVPIERGYVWVEGHMRKDSTPLPSAAPLVEKVKAKLAKAKLSQSSSGSVHPRSIDDDSLSQVFPKKKKGLPGVGCHVSKRQYNASLPGQIIYSAERGEREVLSKKCERMEKKVDQVLDFCTRIIQAQGANGTSMPMIPTISPSTPQSLSGMNSVTSPCNEPTPSAKLCELLDWEGNCVAIAKEVIDQMHRGTCHSYVLDPILELKVSMVSRKIFGAKLYKADKNPESKIIGEVGVGDFIVWPKAHIRYIEQ